MKSNKDLDLFMFLQFLIHSLALPPVLNSIRKSDYLPSWDRLTDSSLMPLNRLQ